MRKLDRYVGILERNIRGMARRYEDEKLLAKHVAQATTLKNNVAKGDFKLVKKTLQRMAPELKYELRYTVAAILRHTGIDPSASIETIPQRASRKQAAPEAEAA